MINQRLTNNCPLCDSLSQKELLILKTYVVDTSPLYKNIIIKECLCCGHLFNELEDQDLKGLHEYYNNEYSLTNLSSEDKIADRPGSSSQNSLNRFGKLYEFSKEFVDENSLVLDVGCAKGGFLEYMYSKGITKLHGIDFSEDFIAYTKTNKSFETKTGFADQIPFEDNKFDIIYMDQVLEHLINPRESFFEVKRVLKEGGYFCIGVPNSLNYADNFIFDFFWFLMKEHIQHFDIHHLILLAAKEGFELIKSNFDNTPMMSGNVYLPNINAVFRYTPKKDLVVTLNDDFFELESNIKKYIQDEFVRLDKKKKLINKIIEKNVKVFFWGIGREFLYLLANTNLEINDIFALIDGNKYKRNNLKVQGMVINQPDILKNSTVDSILVITASAYTKKIKDAAKKLDFLGNIIEI